MDHQLPLPLPTPSEPSSSLEARRLWIGNLDKRVTELQLVKILQNYGPIENFDLLYHKTGPEAGLPRGYAFVTFRDEASALKLKNALDGKKLGFRTLSIQWAHNAEKDNDLMGRKPLAIPALGVTAQKEVKRVESISSKIQAIESKLKMMSQLPEEEFSLSSPMPSSSSIATAVSVTNIPHRNTRRYSKPVKQNRSKPYRR